MPVFQYMFKCLIWIIWRVFDLICVSIVVVPPNGLVIYCGTIVTDEGKEKKVNIDFEPFRPINTSLYLCDNKFHTEVRLTLLDFLRSVWGQVPALCHIDCFQIFSCVEIDISIVNLAKKKCSLNVQFWMKIKHKIRHLNEFDN